MTVVQPVEADMRPQFTSRMRRSQKRVDTELSALHPGLAAHLMPQEERDQFLLFMQQPETLHHFSSAELHWLFRRTTTRADGNAMYRLEGVLRHLRNCAVAAIVAP